MIDEFVYKANPNEWLEVSDELNHLLEILIKNNTLIYLKGDTWDGIPIKKVMNSRSIFLLMGFVIENLLKGILVFDKPENINTGSLSNEIKSHNLFNLAAKIAEISYMDEELKFINTLTEAIPDWGRYPSPLKFHNIKDEVLYVMEINLIYNSVRSKLRENLLNKLKIGWISGLENKKTNVQIIDFIEK